MIDPWDAARQMGIRVETCAIPEAGRWYDDHRLILLRSGLGPVAERCTLAHELGHAALGHRTSTPRHERAADLWAALRLIDHDHLVRLAAAYPAQPTRWSYELDVTKKLMLAYLSGSARAVSAA
ncbi:ImmA/IrrE family metallo-endopeptidase [Schumannella soli]|uniref:ImmA/IrrE family metallo-endopeptidase n=1 Tax=Schumannella soli TaxID=2590779 RepID=A0A506Y0J1_9MICO|nr:ImmA/IrrE family metallo-endopeptidase [Schumannella soli]TPW75492.1 ImmA/IrrE family metallo-endopeptidase [Schumannella soli]